MKRYKDAYYFPTTWFWLRILAVELFLMLCLLVWILILLLTGG